MRKPSLIKKLGTSLKAYLGGYDWVSSGDPGNKYSSWAGRNFSLVGSSVDWDRITGDLLQNSTALACYKWIWQNFNQAKLQVCKNLPTGEIEVVKNSDFLKLMEKPNEWQDWSTINAAHLA